MKNRSIYKSDAGKALIMSLYDQVLARWPVPYEGIYTDTRQGKTFAIASGEKTSPPLVLLHGACSNAVSWVGDAAEYSRHFRVFAVDIPGEPGRSAEYRPDWTGPAFVQWLEDLLDNLEISKTSLAGLSQGGWTALKFATHRPERVEKLVLLAPGGIAPARLSFILRSLPLTLLGRRGAEAINRITFGDCPVHEEAVAFMNAIMTHFIPRIGVLPIFTDGDLQRLTMPVLVMTGTRDALLPTARIVKRLERLVPGINTVVLPDAGHVLINLAPEITPFLTGAIK